MYSGGDSIPHAQQSRDDRPHQAAASRAGEEVAGRERQNAAGLRFLQGTVQCTRLPQMPTVNCLHRHVHVCLALALTGIITCVCVCVCDCVCVDSTKSLNRKR